VWIVSEVSKQTRFFVSAEFLPVFELCSKDKVVLDKVVSDKVVLDKVVLD
jgi:hypothetical protein